MELMLCTGKGTLSNAQPAAVAAPAVPCLTWPRRTSPHLAWPNLAKPGRESLFDYLKPSELGAPVTYANKIAAVNQKRLYIASI